jgi:hypothetical protein
MHHYKYVLGYRPLERPHALDFGTLVHVGLETWWATAGDIALAGAALAAKHSEGQLDEYDLIRADVMLAGYHARWLDEPITVLGVEQEFSVPIRHPAGGTHQLRLAGKWDAICEVDGRVYFPEHKTKSEKVDSSQYFALLRGNLQVSNYLLAALESGHAPGGALYDVLVKLPEALRATPAEDRKYRKDGGLYARQRETDEDPNSYRDRLTDLVCASPDDYYQRAVVKRLEHELDDARLDLWHLADAVLRTGPYAPRNPEACRGFGRLCEYFEVCFGGASLEDSTMYEHVDNPHQELSHATSQAAE